MDKDLLVDLLKSVADGKTGAVDAAARLEHMAYEDITYAHIDHHRSLRKGFPEVIFGEGKTAEQIVGIMEKMQHQENIILVTRIDPEKADVVLARFPKAAYHSDSRMVVFELKTVKNRGRGPILIISAGTSDIPVAKEAYLTAKAMGNTVETPGWRGHRRAFRQGRQDALRDPPGLAQRQGHAARRRGQPGRRQREGGTDRPPWFSQVSAQRAETTRYRSAHAVTHRAAMRVRLRPEAQRL